MINELNIKIFDFIFSTYIGLKGNFLNNSDTNYLCSQLSKLINEFCEENDFWSEYKFCFNDDCVVESFSLGGSKYIYNEFPRMKLKTKKMYLNYKLEQVKKIIENNGDFSKKDFEKITDNIINVGKKEILDYCSEIGIIEYAGKAFIAADNCPAISIIYDNIKPVLYTEEDVQSLIAENIIMISGNGNNIGNVEQNANSKNCDDKLFELVQNKLELLEKEGISKEDLKFLEESCKEKNKGKVVGFLKDVATGTLSSVVASGILYSLGIQ